MGLINNSGRVVSGKRVMGPAAVAKGFKSLGPGPIIQFVSQRAVKYYRCFWLSNGNLIILK